MFNEIAPQSTVDMSELLPEIRARYREGDNEVEECLRNRLLFREVEEMRKQLENTPTNRRFARTADCVVREFFAEPVPAPEFV
jgi:hypothetical protein